METTTELVPIGQKSEMTIMNDINAGFSAFKIDGNFDDSIVVNDKVYNNKEYLFDHLTQNGFEVIEFSRSEGLKYFSTKKDGRIPSEVSNALAKFNLTFRGEPEENELASIFRNIHAFLPTVANGVRFALVVDYLENIAPENENPGHSDNNVIIATESLHKLGTSQLLQRSGNVLLTIVRRYSKESELLSGFRSLCYPMPSSDVIERYLITIQLKIEAGSSKFAPFGDITIQEFSLLAKGLKLVQIKEIFQDAKSKGVPVTRAQVLKNKARYIEENSEGTIRVVQSDVTFNDLQGMEATISALNPAIAKLRMFDSQSPRGYLAEGGWGLGKSTFFAALANEIGFTMVVAKDIKNMYVGESERKMGVFLDNLKAMAPGIAVHFPEVDKALLNPQESSSGDSGTSKNVLSQLQDFMALEEHRGKILWLGDTNYGDQIESAMRSRLGTSIAFVPPSSKHIAAMIERKASVINTSGVIRKDNPLIIKASQLLFNKGATGRKVNDILSNVAIYYDRKIPESFLKAAMNLVPPSKAEEAKMNIATLRALLSIDNELFYPWYLDPAAYEFPYFMLDLVDLETSALQRDLAHQRIRENEKLAT